MGVLFNSSIETLDKISEMIESNTPGGYFRFGDGDVCLMKLDTNRSYRTSTTSKSIAE